MKCKPIPTPKNWQTLGAHALAQLTDFGAGVDLETVTEHMRRHGYDASEPITLFEGKILDGRHRHYCAIQAGVVPTFQVFEGDNAFDFVYKKTLRQHLTTSQRAILIATWAKHVKPGRPKADAGANSPNSLPSVKEEARRQGVSERTARDGVTVVQNGTAALQEAVRNGTVKVSDAAKVADKPASVQNRAVDKVRAGKARTVRETVREPGDDTEEMKAEKRREREEKRSNGAQTYSASMLSYHLGKAAAEIDKLAVAVAPKPGKNGQGTGVQKIKEHQEIIAAIDVVAKKAKDWEAALKRAKDGK